MPFDWSQIIGPLINASGQALGAYANSRQQTANREQQGQQWQQNMLADLFGSQLSAEQAQRMLDQQRQQTGLSATQMDPLAQQRSRARFAVAGEMLGNARNYNVQAPRGMGGFMPQISGGMRLPEGGLSPQTLGMMSPSAALGAEANFAQNAAPFMRPTNFDAVGYAGVGGPSQGSSTGQAAAATAAGQPTDPADPSSGVASAGGPMGLPAGYGTTQGQQGIQDILSGYNRRNEGAGGAGRGALTGASTGASIGSIVPGIGTAIGGAIGGVAGAIGGAFSRNAPTAMTDFSVADARDAITRVYRQAFGRDPEPGAIDTHLRNIGWEPGDEWVGEAGLSYILEGARNSPEGQAYAARQQGQGGGANPQSALMATQSDGQNFASRSPRQEAQSAHDLYIQYLRQQQNDRNRLQSQFEQQRQQLMSMYGGQQGNGGGSGWGTALGVGAMAAPLIASLFRGRGNGLSGGPSLTSGLPAQTPGRPVTGGLI